LDIVYKVHFAHNYWIIALPALFALSDVITGLIQAQINGTKNSSVMRKGLYRKVGELGVILLVWVTCIAIELPIKYPAAVALYVCFMEALSIMENIQAMGIPVPDFITRKAKEISDEINNGDIGHSDNSTK
jgi:toxin secretion/phage lysis holin